MPPSTHPCPPISSLPRPPPRPPPRLQVLPASSSAPKYKFVVPNEYVYKFMNHLVERPFNMRDPGGKLWDCVLIQRKNKVGGGAGWWVLHMQWVMAGWLPAWLAGWLAG